MSTYEAVILLVGGLFFIGFVALVMAALLNLTAALCGVRYEPTPRSPLVSAFQCSLMAAGVWQLANWLKP